MPTNHSPDESQKARIRAHYKAMRGDRSPSRAHFEGNIWMRLAQHWKRPIAEIKRIVKEP